jgi:hypothetical protein
VRRRLRGDLGTDRWAAMQYTITREQLTEVVETLRAALDDVLAQI